MGFSLSSFIQELEDALNTAEPDEIKWRRLKDIVEDNKKYAKECNQL